ncbi:MAG TPA: hypothetical protein VGU71_13395 [Candidatus Dormibacteraeota bacterium]|nr:hypothetical protein [Candidatus Dormibacteraeota bacterium]
MLLSRREFLAAANAVALLALIESCVPGAVTLGSKSPASGGTPFERALKLLRAAVRASPDHLAQRSGELVAARDSNRIVEFVRDRIAVVPPFSFLDDPRTARRWGMAATLRGGQGTLRDRAEVMADMLTRAGFPAKVMAANRPASISQAELYRSRAVQFTPDMRLVEQATALLRKTGASAPAAPQPFDPGPDPVPAILGALPAPLQTARVRPDLMPAQIPVVVFEAGGKTRYAFGLGDHAVSDSPPAGLTNAPAADNAPPVSVTISAVSSPAPGSNTARGRQLDLVAGKWAADVVVGKQLLLTFMPPQGPKSYLEHPLSSLPIRVPVLRVQTDTPPVDAATNLTVTGPLITMHGDVIAKADQASSGAIDGPYGTIRVLSDADRKQAVARVTTVQAAANATAFPEVSLEVSLTDKAGRSVDGLDASAFTIKENGKAIGGFTILANARSQDRPRVLVAYDSSGSVLSHWPSSAARAAFEKNLAEAIASAGAQTPFDVQVVGLDTQPDPKAWSAPQASTIATAMAAGRSGDQTWGTIANAALDQGVVAIAWAGDSSDDDTPLGDVPALQRRLASSGVPVLCVPIGPTAGPSTDKIVSVSGGARFDISDPAMQAKIADWVRQSVATWMGGAYRIRYVASAGSPDARTVTVALADRPQTQASATYQVPANPLQPPSFVSLYVTIEVGGLRSMRRLAGLPLTSRGNPLGVLDDPAAVAETRAALDGITTIAIEPGTPASAAVLDDVLTSCLSVEPLRAIWPIKNPDQVMATLKNGVRRTPGLFASLLRPATVDAAAVPGLKVAILQEREVTPDLIERHMDLAVGTNPMIAVTADTRAAFKAAVAGSVAACAAEAATFDDSAYRRLSGRPLTALTVGDLAARTAFLNAVAPDKLDSWKAMTFIYEDFHLLVPAAGGGDAFWIVDPGSGAAKAMLLDGAGGARILTGCKVSTYGKIAMTLSMLSIYCGTLEQSGATSLQCIGINNAAIAMTVAALFIPGEADAGTPFGAALGLFNPLGSGGALNGALGVALILVTMQASCS